MNAKRFKRVLALVIAGTMFLTACGQKETPNTSESKQTSESKTQEENIENSESEVKREDLPIITFYPEDQNLFSGLRGGYQGDFFAKYGFQLEVWAFSEEKTNAILTSGDLPDMMCVGAGGTDTLETLIETGKIINFEDYKDKLPNFFGENRPNQYLNDDNYDIIRENYSAGTNGLYILPMGVGVKEGVFQQTGTFDRNVVKLKWDVYEAIGTPEITDIWQLLDVVEDMMEYQPKAEDGTVMHGTYLDNGLDTDCWGSMYLWNLWHGYEHSAHNMFVEIDVVNGTVESIFEDDSVYKEGARWYNEIYRRGLMDPDSISTSRTDQAPKVDGYAMMPAGTLPGWADKYYEVFVPGLTVYRDFTKELMNYISASVMINAETEHLDECLAFVNMLADPYAGLNLVYGPEGDIWETDGNVLKITDRFAEWLEEKGAVNWFPMSDGTEWDLSWNTGAAYSGGTPVPGFVGTNGEPVGYIPTTWPEAQVITSDTENWNAWKESMDAEDLWDYCEKNNITVYQSSPFDGVVKPTPDDNQTLTIATVKDVLVPAVWQCVYAESEEEFEEIWDQMVEDAMALGAQDIIDWYIENYKPNK